MIIDIQGIENELSNLRENNIRLIESNYKTIDETIENLNNINEYLSDPSLIEKISKLNEIGVYIDTNNIGELKRVKSIADSTPLDLTTSSIVAGYGKKLDISTSLLLALIEQESNFNQYEIGTHQDRGYCQIIPDTERWLANSYGHILGIEYDVDRIFEPEYNIGLGALYLYNLKKAYGNNYHKILSEYNRGIFNLQKYYNEHGTYVTTYSRGVLNREAKYINFNPQ